MNKSNKCAKTGKTIFDTKSKAQQFIDNKEHIKNENHFLRPYYCEYCNHWHLSKMTEEEREKKFPGEEVKNEAFKKFMKGE